MRFKTRLALACSLFALVVFTVVAGVLAVTTLNFNIGGTIKFKAKGINATISAGTLSSTGSHVTSTDSTNKMKQIVLSTTTEDPNHSTNVASWAGLNLLFNENGDDVTISFSITNDATTASGQNLYTKITTSAGSGATNATISVNTPTAEIAPTATQNFVITFHITEKTLNAELPNFAITVELAMTSFDAASLSFDDYITGQNTVAVSGFDGSLSNINIPTTITKDGVNYTISTIKSTAFVNSIVIKSVTIPSSVTLIEPGAFVGCSSLENVTFANPNSWYVTSSADSTSGTGIDVSNATTNVESLKTLYAGKYLKCGEYTQPKVLTIQLNHPIVQEIYYVQYEDGMTWQDLINNESLNQVTNAQNSLIGKIVIDENYLGYQDDNHSFYVQEHVILDGTVVCPADLIDPSNNYMFYREASTAPYFLVIV